MVARDRSHLGGPLPSCSMNLRSVRLRLTIMFTALLVVVVVIMAVIAGRSGTDRIAQSAEREVDLLMNDALVESGTNPEFTMNNAWRVNPVDEWDFPLGNVSVEPPLFSIAKSSRGGPSYTKFEQDGSWLATGRRVGEDEYFVIAIQTDPFDSDASSLKWRLSLAAAGLVLAAGFAGWRLAGRSLAPARQAMDQQRDFIADAAHELRTPLAVIQASASQALSRERETWEYQRSLAEIQVATERAGNGVNSLLEMARLEAGHAVPRLAPLRLDLLLEEVAAATRIEGVVVETGELAPTIVNADYGLLRQALSNLTSNAGARADRVTLGIRTDEPWAIAEIVDDGPGFDPEVLPHVFTRFKRGDEKGASGLGLAIVKTIVDVHHGTIDAENCPEGGARVSLRLKIAG